MKNILCACSAYNNKFWINPDLPKLPQAVVDELKILCVLFVEDVGGVILLHFDDEGNLYIDLQHNEGDYYYDEIGAQMRVKKVQEENEELFKQLELYYEKLVRGEDGSRD